MCAAALGSVVTLATMNGCQRRELTREEAASSLAEAALEAEAAQIVSAPIEVGTNFTIGQAISTAASELRRTLERELPCANVTLDAATVVTDWGVRSGCAAASGGALTGRSTLTITRNDAGAVVVTHAYQDLSNGRVRVNGSARVTWSAADTSRRIEHALEWERLSDGRRGVGTGDRVQRLIDPKVGLSAGIAIEGNRTWRAEGRRWDLALRDVEVRLQDPVPQAGTYTLTTPTGAVLTVEFVRRDASSIHVEVSDEERSFSFVVRTWGSFEER
jgi:hypothetical protein